MTNNFLEHRAALSAVSENSRYDDAIVRKARRALLASRISIVTAGLMFGMFFLSILFYKPARLGVSEGPSPEQLRAEALHNIGAFSAMLVIMIIGLICFIVALRYARKWARTASEAIAKSEIENRKVLQRLRSSGTNFSLFLRGFQEEGKSFQNLMAVPISTRRPDQATRWIESEIIDQLNQREIIAFCIANPSDTFMLPGAIRLRASPEAWQSEVLSLAKESVIIVVYLSSASHGLQIELNLLRREKLEPRTIVVISKGMQAHHRVMAKGFPIVVAAPSLSPLNQSAFGPMIGRNRFRRALTSAINTSIQ